MKTASVLFPLCCILGVGCAAPQSDAQSSESNLTNQASPDVTVVKADVRETLDHNAFPDSDCAKGSDDTRKDCTAAFEKSFQGTPALHDLDLMKNDDQFYCHVLHVTTASRSAALDAASGIGFYYAGYGASHGRFIPKEKLKKVGDTTLKNGEPGVLHEFVALAECWQGSGTSSRDATYTFKPYMQFQTSGETYDNWDTSSDYVIGYQSTSHIDRSAAVLR